MKIVINVDEDSGPEARAHDKERNVKAFFIGSHVSVGNGKIFYLFESNVTWDNEIRI